jgi:hypothetical protein
MNAVVQKNQLDNKKNTLILIKKSCDHGHNHCFEISNTGIENINLVTQKYFDDFLAILKNNNYNSCLSSYGNRKSVNVKNFINKCSEKFYINHWECIITFYSDDELILILKNQFNLNDKFIEYIINLDGLNLNYGGRTNFINSLLSHPIKLTSFEHIIMLMNINQFYEIK